MADWGGIRAAIAAQYAAVEGLRESTSTNFSLGPLPALKVERVSDLSINNTRGGRGAGFESRLARIEGKLLVASSADVGRNQVMVETLVESLFTAARTGLRLGYSTIVEDSWLDSVEIGPQIYAGQELYGADLTWVVKTIEPATRTS